MTEHERLANLYSVLAPRIGALLAGRFPRHSGAVPDAVHDVFVRVLDNKKLLHRLSSMTDVDAAKYLLVAARNLLISRLRGQKRVAENLDDLLGSPAALIVPLERNPMDALRDRISLLRPPYREVLELLLLEDYNVTEISTRTGRTMATVYQQVHRGMAQLREKLRDKS